MVSSESKLLSALCHGSLFIGMPIIIPLVIYLFRKEDEYVNHHAREALAMHIISIILGLVVGISCLLLIGLLLVIPLAILGIIYAIFAVVAIVKSLSGEYYYYPITTKYAKSWFQ
ncbi:hypothetical protein SAMN05660649_04175 [Desulfotomaculum arcticum]|uniref:DUF4870 domain-containing protein n=1 Tax=Desulfotruncus arcticus DSM 17038 TaxID=1121424 RepID=A0A1I2XXT9_9FIRM|nr:DUF4870 domain-containing protein [Desulfotruncus arcticus]SFH18162.1 hypothetical protein SAMN05660649_04175 [Desulfotomaculum arcticum] [Desulfotruncus arcticus DSM 17038]